MTYRVKKLEYAINDRLLGSRIVTGYAIDSGLPVRIAMHKGRFEEWIFDHWDSGFCFSHPVWATRKAAAEHAVRMMREAIDSGKLEKCLRNLRRKGLIKQLNA